MLKYSFIVLLAACSQQELGSVQQADETTPWEVHTIHAGLTGADGTSLTDVNGDGLLDVATPWEQSAKTTVSLHPGLGMAEQPWDTVVVGNSLGAVEDAIFADVDADGAVDVITGSENKKIFIHFAPTDPALYLTSTAWTTIIVAPATNLQRWMKVAVADMNSDGRLDIIAGGRIHPASVQIFYGPTTPRTGTSWTREEVSQAGWVMSLLTKDVDVDGDLDIILSDRTYYKNLDNSPNYSLVGSRWIENAAGWPKHSIGSSAGEPKFLSLSGNDVWDCSSNANHEHVVNRVNAGNWLDWTATEIINPTNVGQCQDVKVGDIDRDGILDVVTSYSASEGALSGVVWQRGPNYDRNEVSGESGSKYDNVDLVDVDVDGDLDILTSEQADGLSIVWYENPVSLPTNPDAGGCL